VPCAGAIPSAPAGRAYALNVRVLTGRVPRALQLTFTVRTGVVGSLQPGDPQHLGPYRLLEVLGAGGFGRVFLGRPADGRLAAVKMILSDHSANPEYLTRFQREAAAARKVGWPVRGAGDQFISGPPRRLTCNPPSTRLRLPAAPSAWIATARGRVVPIHDRRRGRYGCLSCWGGGRGCDRGGASAATPGNSGSGIGGRTHLQPFSQ
jgi:hypothetical protein